jgi:signal transduction histidine kinase
MISGFSQNHLDKLLSVFDGTDSDDLFIIEHEVNRPDGIVKNCEVRIEVHTRNDEGKPVIITGVNIDTTDLILARKEAYILDVLKDKAEQASQSKSLFLANMSHEIRTPLNGILGFISLLKAKTEDTKSLEYLNIIDNSSQSLLKIIEDILDFSKIESGKIEIDKIDFDTKVELEMVAYLYEAKCLEKNIYLYLNIDENVPQYLNTDPYRIKQIVSNLLSNALKFTPEGKSITVSISYSDKLLHFSVKDEGKGITKDKQQQIFTAFTQEESSTTREYGGTGLGLSISTQLVKLLGGDLKIKSELGKGSEFYFSLPVEIAEPIEETTAFDTEVNISGNILLVEDNLTNQLLMKIFLKELNLEYEIANDGLESVAMFKENRYDAILMDENMPNMV